MKASDIVELSYYKGLGFDGIMDIANKFFKFRLIILSLINSLTYLYQLVLRNILYKNQNNYY